MQIDVRPAGWQTDNSLFDWRLDVERLEREAQAAALKGEPDPWALVEAECSLDLIEAELMAAKNSRAEQDKVSTTVQLLEQWRSRLRRVISKLNASGADDAGAGAIRRSG